MPSFQDKESAKSVVPVFSPSINSGTKALQNLPEPCLVPAKTILLEQGERPSTVRLVRSGIVKVTCSTESGQETLLGLRSEGWWAGAQLVLLDLPSLCTLTALTPCLISSISADEFTDTLMQNQRVLRHFITAQCREMMVQQKYCIVQELSAYDKLKYLQSESINPLWHTVDPTLIMRQGEIAKLLSITPEHLSRLLRQGAPPWTKAPRSTPRVHAPKLARAREG